MLSFKQFMTDSFDPKEFDRHMEKLKARKELEKTDPMRAMVNKMRDDEHAKQKKSPKHDDERKITDPFHPSQSVNIDTK